MIKLNGHFFSDNAIADPFKSFYVSFSEAAF